MTTHFGNSGLHTALVPHLIERDLRLKEDRRAVLNNLVVLSGGTIALSITVFEKIAPGRRVLWLLPVAWVVLGCALMFALAALVGMTYRSISYQTLLLDELYSVPADRTDFHFHYRGSGSSVFLPFAELIVGVTYLVGAGILGCFAMLNL